MKEVLICTWDIAPGNGKQTQKFSSYDEANTAIRKLLCEKIDITDCINRLKKAGDFQYVNAVTTFLTKYFSDPLFPYTESDLPSDNPQDYDDCDLYPEDNEFFNSDNYNDELFAVWPGGFRYCYDGYTVTSDFVLDKEMDSDSFNDGLRFEFENENGKVRTNAANDLVLNLISQKNWGTGAYPIMILKILQNSTEPMFQLKIAEKIEKKYGISIERKAIGRNINMLIELDYDIRKTEAGCYLHTDQSFSHS